MAKKQPKKALKAESQATNPPVEQDPPNPEASGIVLARDLMPEALPVIPLNERPVFPKMTVPVIIDNAHLAQAIIKWVESGSRYVALVLRQPPQEDNPDKNLPPLYKVGTVAEDHPDGKIRLRARNPGPAQCPATFRNRHCTRRSLHCGKG
jgi:hypothetical protein